MLTNLLTKQRNLYQKIKTIDKISSTNNTLITSVETGITILQTLPYPAIGIPPLGLPPLTSGIIETVGATADLLQVNLNKAKIV